MKNIFNKKFYISIVCLLLVAIIPLCSINLINYSNLLATTSQEETIDDETSSPTDDGSGSGESENAEVINDSDIADDSSDVSVSVDDEYWTDPGNYTQPTQVGGVYIIDSPQKLAWISYQSAIRSLTGTYRLTANIDLSDHYWDPIDLLVDGRFIFDGDGYTISGLTIYKDFDDTIGSTGAYHYDESGRDWQGLFGFIWCSTGNYMMIRDVIVEGSIDYSVHINLQSISFFQTHKLVYYIGGIAGLVRLINGGGIHPYVSISNCISKVDINVEISGVSISGINTSSAQPYFAVGGIVGAMLDAYFIDGDGSNAPKKVAYAEAFELEECVNFGNITTIDVSTHEGYNGNSSTGGIIGYADAISLQNCVNYGGVRATYVKWTGGIIGVATANSSIEDYIAYPNIVIISHCINFGYIYGNTWTGLESCTGGIVGQLSYNHNRDILEYSTLTNCVNMGSISGVANKSAGLGEIVGWVGGHGADIHNCYANPGIKNNDSNAVNFWIGRFSGYELDDNFVDGTGTAQNNKTYTGNFSSYSTVLSSYSSPILGYFSGGYSSSNNSSTWTGVDFYSNDVTISTCPNSSYPVTLSWFVKDMNIKIKVRNSDGTLSDFEGDDFSIDSKIRGLHRNSSCNYDYYATITNFVFTPFTLYNDGGYDVEIYYSDGNELGSPIEIENFSSSYDYRLGGTYDELFADITIVLEKEEEIPITINSDFRVWTSDSLYAGEERFGTGSNQLSIEQGTEGLENMRIYVDNVLKYDTSTGLNELSNINIESDVRVEITAADNYEILGFYERSNFETNSINNRIENFNNVVFEGVEGEDSARTRVTSNWTASNSILTVSFKLEDLILSITEEPIEEGEVEANRLIPIGPEILPEEDNETSEEPETPMRTIYEYASAFDVVLVPYRQNYYLDISYVNSGSDSYIFQKGYASRARNGQRSRYTASMFNITNGPSSTEITFMNISSGRNYFTSNNYVAYVAEVSGAKNGYWYSVGFSSSTAVTNLWSNDVVMFTPAGTTMLLLPANVFYGVAPRSRVSITFKYCESERYEYDYTLYLTDAYEVYGSNSYLPGQLVGETNYFATSQISKTDIDVDGYTVSATEIPMSAVFREQFSFDRYNILSSDFNGIVDTTNMLETPSTTVGGRSISINSVLSGGVVRSTTKDPIVGYTADNAFYFSSGYSNPSTTNLADWSLYSIMNRYGNLSENGNTVTLFTFFHIRNPYTVTVRTRVNGSTTTFSMPAGSSEYLFAVNGVSVSGSSTSVSCEPFDLINISVTDKLVYTYNSARGETTFYSFDNITLGSTVLSDSDDYSFQMIPTNDVSSITVNINFKEEFTLSSSDFVDSTPINYSSSIWEVDSSADLLNIAYRMYYQGLTVAKKIVQTADIDFEGGYMLPIGTASNSFESVYDGGYYRIENMNIVGGNAVNMGLFGYTDGATIKNLTLMNSSVSGRGNVGAVVGYGNDTTLERVGVYDSTTTIMEAQDSGTGIFFTNGNSVRSVSRASGTYTTSTLGNNSAQYTMLSVMISNSVTNSSDTAGYAGDLAGNLNNSTIDTCYERKSNTDDSTIGGLVGRATGGSITYSYTSRARVVYSSSGVSQTHTHTNVTNITSTCGTCGDLFIW